MIDHEKRGEEAAAEASRVFRAALHGAIEPTLTDLLADALRKMLEANGRPAQHEYQRKDMGLYHEHVRQWEQAKAVLARYDLTRL